MKKLLRVKLSVNGEHLAECRYTILEPYAPTTLRRFTFKSIKFKKKININRDTIIQVYIAHSARYYHRRVDLYDFEILVRKADDIMDSNDWSVYGTVEFTFKGEYYAQGIVDIFNTWGQGKEIDWSIIPMYSSFKREYLDACYHYSSISTNIIEADSYTLDMSLIKEENDFLYWISRTFFGERGYMGYEWFTFQDCLLSVYQKKGYFQNKKMIFLNSDNLYDLNIDNLYRDIKKEFDKYKFDIIEE